MRSGSSANFVFGLDDAFLVRDQNKNGRIDNANELFGITPTLERNDSKLSNGFEVLKRLDSNKDSLFDKGDKQWKEVQVWLDKNFDGVSQKDELFSLDTVGVVSIDLDYDEESMHVDSHGNRIREYSAYLKTEKDGTMRALPIANIWFNSFRFRR